MGSAKIGGGHLNKSVAIDSDIKYFNEASVNQKMKLEKVKLNYNLNNNP